MSIARLRFHALALGAGLAALAGSSAPAGAASTEGRLEVHWIDVEGGAATLFVTPAGESILVDAGMPMPRDVERIEKAIREDAGLERLDLMVVTHFDLDHYGGVADLSTRVPIGRVLDPGLPERANPVWNPGFERYEEAVGDRRSVLRAGEEIALRAAPAGSPGAASAPLRIRCLGGSQKFVELGPDASGSPAPANPHCADHVAKDRDTSQNAESLVLLVEFGPFRLLDAADLTWNLEADLVCPSNPVGEVDVYQVDHHGIDASNNPVLVRTIRPTVAIANNGPKKGPGPATYATLATTDSIRAIFQMHRNVDNAAAAEKAGVTEGPAFGNTADARIANPTGTAGETIRLAVDPDGRGYAVRIPSRGIEERFETRGR